MSINDRKYSKPDVELLLRGSCFKIYYVVSGKTIKDFILGMETPLRSKVLALLENFAKREQWTNTELVKSLEDGIFEFRPFPARILFFYDKGRVIILTHGFIKKRDRTPRKEIIKAKKIKDEYFKKKEA